MEHNRQPLKIKGPILIMAALPIVVLATYSHFEAHYENALTGLVETDYAVHIPVWRIVFEPFLGPLLFFNQSLYALRELPLALFWALLCYIVYGAVQVVGHKKARKATAIRILGNLPLVLGICFAIFALVLFVPLPNNTIVNRSQTTVLVTTHAHSEFSHDGLISQKKMWEWHKRNGFDAFFITDHAHYQKTLQFVRAQRNGDFPMDPLVLVGQEHSGSNHLSLLGLTGTFETKGMEDRAVVDSVHQYGGAVLVNHWFDGKGKEKEFYRDIGVDGFEIENAGIDLYYDRAIFNDLKKFCEDNNLTMVGGLDFHGYGRACSLYNALEIPDWDTMEPKEKERAVLEILRNGPQEKIKVLMYKDRPFYGDSHLVLRPFLTVIHYFRTLGLSQVLSWLVWLCLLQWIVNRKSNKWPRADKIILATAAVAAIFLLGLSLVYYVRGEAVKGYSKVYSEYFTMLAGVGAVLMAYVLLLVYLRVMRPAKTLDKA